MERKIKITNAEAIDDTIVVSYSIIQVADDGSETTLKTSTQAYSNKCTEADIEKHLTRILETEPIEGEPSEEQIVLDSPAIFAESLKDKEIKSKENK